MMSLTDARLHAVLSFDVRILLIAHIEPPKSILPPPPRPALNFVDMQDDLARLVASIAYRYTDQSCIFLHTDELEAELRLKLVKAQDSGLKKAKGSRVKFFAYIKAALSNHVRSLVQRHRFTQKRTGVKPPSKKDRFTADFKSYKPNEVSLDDPDSHLQVGEQPDESSQYVNELVQDIVAQCSPLQELVFKQLTAPNEMALIYARLESAMGKLADKVRIDINRANMADGLGISLELFEKTVLELQQITVRVREMKPESINYDAAVATLANIFSLQIPKSTPQMVVRRLLTLAARDNWQKVNADVEDLLDSVGASAPKFNSTAMGCFGVLYQRGHRICEACGVKESCRVQAQNIGLGEITLSPKLLGTKLNRTPYVLPNPDRTVAPLTANQRDMEITDYLFANYQQVTHNSELYFRPKEFKNKEKMILCVGISTIPLRLRFCNPAPELRKALTLRGKNYFIPDAMEADTVIKLVNEHTKNAYAVAD